MITVNNFDELPMKKFKAFMKTYFRRLVKIYESEEEMNGQGILFVEYIKKKEQFDVYFVSIDKMPPTNHLKKIATDNDSTKYMLVVGNEGKQCVTMRLEKKLKMEVIDASKFEKKKPNPLP